MQENQDEHFQFRVEWGSGVWRSECAEHKTCRRLYVFFSETKQNRARVIIDWLSIKPYIVACSVYDLE